MIKTPEYKGWIYLVCCYYYNSLNGISACFDSEELANEFANHLKENMDPALNYRVVKRALLK